MSYFPYQPTPHVVQLSVQQINITKATDSSSSPKDESSSKSSSTASYPQETCEKAKTLKAKAALEAKIQTKFRTNLSEHHAEYMDQYKENKSSSKSSSNNLPKSSSDFSEKHTEYMDQDEDEEDTSGAGFKEFPVGPGLRRNPERLLDNSGYSERMKKESSTNAKVKQSETRKPKRNRYKSKAISSHRKKAGGGGRSGGFNAE